MHHNAPQPPAAAHWENPPLTPQNAVLLPRQIPSLPPLIRHFHKSFHVMQ